MAENTREKVFPAVSLGDLQALIDDRFIPASLGGSSQYAFDVEEFSDPPCLGGSSEKTTLSSAGSGGDAGEEGNACGEGEQGDLNTSSNAGLGSLSFSVATTAESPDSAMQMLPVSLQEHSSAKQRPGLERRSGQRGLALQQQSTASHSSSLNSITQHNSTEGGGMDTTEAVATAVVNSKEGGTEGREGTDGAEENDRALVSPLSDECDVPAVLNYSQRENGECTENQRQQVEREAEENRQTPLAAAAEEELGEVEEEDNVWVEVSSQSGAEEEDEEVEGPAAGTVSGESYHYSALLCPADGGSVTSASASRMPRPFPDIQDLSPVGTSRNSDFISAGSTEEGDCWQEVGSVDSGDGPAAEAAEEVAVAAVLSSEDSRADSATVPVPTVVAAVAEKADALLTAYVHMSLSVLWCAAVALVVGAGLYSTYYPEAPSATVSVAFLARLALFALLLCCFL